MKWLAENELVVYAVELVLGFVLIGGLQDGAFDRYDAITTAFAIGLAMLAVGGLYALATWMFVNPDERDHPREYRSGTRWINVGCIGMILVAGVIVYAIMLRMP